MQLLLTTSQIRSIDKETISGDLSVGYSLMQQAANGIANEITDACRGDIRKKIAIICGKGNNGGDGYLAAKKVIESGFHAECFALCLPKELNGEALLAFKEFEKFGIFHLVKSIDDLQNLSSYRIIVDAIFGTGTKGAPRGIYAEVIEYINRLDQEIISIDTPSGLNSDTGEIYKPCINADITVDLGFAKIGQYFYPGKKVTGYIKVKDLNYPKNIINSNFSKIYRLEEDDIWKIIPPRKKGGSKHDHGLLAVLAGSKGMTGAATLALNAAMRSGCGMAHAFISEEILNILSIKVTEPVLHIVKATETGSVSTDAFDEITKKLSKMNSFLIGPGISLNENTQTLVRKLVKSVTIPLILDADGLNAFRDNSEFLKDNIGNLILTPHEGEFERLFGSIPNTPVERINRCREVAEIFKCVVVLKGAPTVVSDSKKSYIIDSGDSSLATAGTGDILAGIISSLSAQGATNLDAALAGVYLHGLVGKKCSEEFSAYGVIAGDLCENIGRVIKSIMNNKI